MCTILTAILIHFCVSMAWCGASNQSNRCRNYRWQLLLALLCFTNDTESIFINRYSVYLSSIILKRAKAITHEHGHICKIVSTWQQRLCCAWVCVGRLEIFRERMLCASVKQFIYISIFLSRLFGERTQRDDDDDDGRRRQKWTKSWWWFTHHTYVFIAAICCVHFSDYCWANHLFMHFVCNCLYSIFIQLLALLARALTHTQLTSLSHLFTRDK